MSEESLKTSLESDGYLPPKIWEEIARVSKEKKLSSNQKEKLIESVRKEYMKSIFEPGDAVGIIAAQSISEPATQMSHPGSEKVIVKTNNKIKSIKIGELVDNMMKLKGSLKINDSEVLPLNDIEISVPTLNEKEKIEWKRIVEFSRHKYGKKLMRLITASGREVTATDNHSFVIRKNNKIVPIVGAQLKMGDRIPVINNFFSEKILEEIRISDTISSYQLSEQDDLVYGQRNNSKRVKNTIPLDWQTGWFVGAYLAEGSCNVSQIGISNINENYIQNSKLFAESIGLDYRDRQSTGEYGPCRTLVMNSSILAKFISASCGKGSDNKRVPDFAFNASDEFVSGLLRGYFDGDGNFQENRKMIRTSSNSKELLDGIALLLSRFKIFSFKTKDVKDQHWLLIPYKYAPIFLLNVGSGINYKLESLKIMSEMSKRLWNIKSQDYTDMISGFGDLFWNVAKKLGYASRYVNNFTKRQKIGRTALFKYIKIFEDFAKEKGIDIKNELNMMKQMAYSDIIWDEIVDIQYVNNEYDYVYDFSVPGTETFTTFEGIITHNTMRTFHFAASAGVQITLGLPRLVEIFDARKESSTPIMTLYLKSKYNTQSKVEEFAKDIREKRLRNFVSTVSIDLTNRKIKIELKKIKKSVLKEMVDKLEKSFKNYKIKSPAGKIELEPKEEQVTVKELEQVKKKLLALHVMGLQGIKNTIVIKEGKDWAIKTLGSNFAKILLLEEVDFKRCYTNNIHEIAKVLGIEAARTALIREINETIQQQGLDIDERHINLVADIMTLIGDVMAVGRYGVAGTKSSVLARAGFEETIKHLVRASVRNEIDTFDGIFDNVMINHQIPVGTGMFELVSRIEEEE